MGGLGDSATPFRAALGALPLTARVIVAELVAEVVDWNSQAARAAGGLTARGRAGVQATVRTPVQRQ